MSASSASAHTWQYDLPRLGDDPKRMYRLGIMGGTFDPIHNGHLVAAEQARSDLALDAVVFMPAGSPAFKQNRGVSAAEDRYAMTLLATADNPNFLVSRYEIDRAGITYTVDTLSGLRELYPSNVELYFITGADAIMEVIRWHNAEKIGELATLVAATRPGYDLDRASDLIDESGMNFDVIYLEVPALAISSSYLRARVKNQKSIRYLVPESVLGYVQKSQLYQASQKDYA